MAGVIGPIRSYKVQSDALSQLWKTCNPRPTVLPNLRHGLGVSRQARFATLIVNRGLATQTRKSAKGTGNRSVHVSMAQHRNDHHWRCGVDAGSKQGFRFRQMVWFVDLCVVHRRTRRRIICCVERDSQRCFIASRKWPEGATFDLFRQIATDKSISGITSERYGRNNSTNRARRRTGAVTQLIVEISRES